MELDDAALAHRSDSQRVEPGFSNRDRRGQKRVDTVGVADFGDHVGQCGNARSAVFGIFSAMVDVYFLSFGRRSDGESLIDCAGQRQSARVLANQRRVRRAAGSSGLSKRKMMP